MSQDHDNSYKYLFSHPELVRDLILGFVPDPWLQSLDFQTLEKIPGSYVTDDFRQREDDLIWRIKAEGEWVYLYILLEFQSTVDRYMAVRMLVYVGLLYQDLIKRGEVLNDGKLPPILPIVLYNGQTRWQAKIDIADLIPTVPGLVVQYRPQLKYLIIDEGAYTEHHLASLKNLVAAVFQIEQYATPHSLKTVLALLQEWLKDEPLLQRSLARWLRVALKRTTRHRIDLPELNDLEEIKTMLADRLEQWAESYEAIGIQKGIQKGLQKGLQKGEVVGIQKGEAHALQRLLAHRFGDIPSSLKARIAEADMAQLEAWLDRVLDVDSLDELFH